jgi:hypothetical protein
MAGKRKTVTWEVDENGCHICTSHSPGAHGYPQLWKDGTNQNAHRVLYEEAFGELDDNIVVRHTCDVRMCINLAHLIPGTRADNTQDITDRKRHNPPVGERAGNTNLKQSDVEAIIAANDNQKIIAAKYGISQSQVSRIKSGKRWSHIAFH